MERKKGHSTLDTRHSIKIIISGGGTGGHIYPALSIGNELLRLEENLEVIFIGGKDRLEAQIVPRHNFPFIPISVAGFPRRLTWRWLQVIPKVLLGFVSSLNLLRRLKPKVVVGTGGYVCGPVLLAGALLRIPTLIQEQNAVPGLTNRILGRWVDEIHVSFVESTKYFKQGKRKASERMAPRVKVTGNPIRREIEKTSKATITNEIFAKFGLKSSPKTVFVMGGSQGAHSINVAVIEALNKLESSEEISELQIIHQTGQDDYEMVSNVIANKAKQSAKSKINHFVQPFFLNIPEIYALTDLMICRAGAMTLAEITVCGLPAILIPYPHSTGDHQMINAQAMKKNGAAILINDEELTGEILAKTLLDLLEDNKTLAKMAAASKKLGKPDAAEKIAQAVLKLIYGDRPMGSV
ncbi:MAG: undecaprenyldiphospho-muramoylpentapeptide beta-N-acetylglucosaminyltransferase [Deltaproteobacteria bacterium]|nr:undecaprenyldiphospho-muramoylpentapeptide beta-N-acetylglucosaminyltransferase [Deltaproteobacteria bacterium]